MRRTAVLFGVVVLALTAVLVARPWLARERDFAASVPSPAALRAVSTVTLRPGHPVCFSSVAIEQHSSQVRLVVAAGSRPGPPLIVALRGPGYRADVPIAAGYVNEQVVAVPVVPPARPVPVRVCVSNLGDRAVALLASDARTRSRSLAVVDGKTVSRSVWFGFYEATPQTIPDRLSAIVARMTVFRPGYVTQGVLWALIVLMVFGVPFGAVWAFGRALEEDDRAQPDRAAVDVATPRPWWRRLVG